MILQFFCKCHTYAFVHIKHSTYNDYFPKLCSWRVENIEYCTQVHHSTLVVTVIWVFYLTNQLTNRTHFFHTGFCSSRIRIRTRFLIVQIVRSLTLKFQCMILFGMPLPDLEFFMLYCKFKYLICNL